MYGVGFEGAGVAVVGEAISFKFADVPVSADEGVGGISAVVEPGDVTELFLFGAGLAARSPVLCIMEPSFRERMSVDWTPGRELR